MTKTVLALTALLLVGIGVLTVLRWRSANRVAEEPNVHPIPPGELLYSTPTLCDALPARTAAAVPADALVVHEDDWRQVEFVAASDRPEIERQIKELQDFKTKHRKGPAWDSVYVRKGRDEALAPAHIATSSVAALLAKAPKRALAVHTLGRTVAVQDGFAVEISRGLTLYGQDSAGTLLSLGLALEGKSPDFASVEDEVQALCDRAKIDLVDWYGAQIALQAAVE